MKAKHTLSWQAYRRGEYDWFFDLVLLPAVVYFSYKAWTPR
jgi:hypothetical protein